MSNFEDERSFANRWFSGESQYEHTADTEASDAADPLFELNQNIAELNQNLAESREQEAVQGFWNAEDPDTGWTRAAPIQTKNGRSIRERREFRVSRMV